MQCLTESAASSIRPCFSLFEHTSQVDAAEYQNNRLAIVSAPLDTAPLVSAPLVSAPLVSAPLDSAPIDIIELVCGGMGTTKAGMGDKMV
jgi:hypothetical protein